MPYGSPSCRLMRLAQYVATECVSMGMLDSVTPAPIVLSKSQSACDWSECNSKAKIKDLRKWIVL